MNRGKRRGLKAKLPVLFLPRAGKQGRGAGGSPVLPNPAAKGSRRLRGKGKRAREARGVDSRPQLGPRWPEVA